MDGLVACAQQVVLLGQFVDLVGILGSPAGGIDIFGAEGKLSGGVERTDAAADVLLRIKSQQGGVGAVGVGGVEHGSGVPQLAVRGVERCLVGLVGPLEGSQLVAALVVGQVVTVLRAIGHEAERAGGRQVVGQLGVVVVGGVVHAAVFGQQVVEEVEPAAAGAHQVGQLVLEDGPLEGDACGRHVERQGADVLLQVTFLEVDFGDRREPALEAGGEETFVEDHAPDGIAVEHGQQGVDVAGVVDWHAVQQELVFVAAAAVHLEVAAGGEARHARQYPDLREQVVAAERQEVRRRELAQLAAVLVRLHSDLGYLEQLGRERGAERAVAVHTDGLGVGLIAHVADIHTVVTLGQVEAEAPVGIGQGVPLAFFAVVQHHDGPIEPSPLPSSATLPLRQ